MRNFLIGAVVLFMLSSCATGIMSEKQCVAGDWYSAGMGDGLAGETEDVFSERASRCAEFGAPANSVAYLDGRRAGLDQLCTEEGGYRLGYGGGNYKGVCRADEEDAFLDGYLSGQNIHYLEAQRETVRNEYSASITMIGDYQTRIDVERKLLKQEDISEEEIVNARKRMKEARHELRYAEEKRDQHLYELGRADEALDAGIASIVSDRDTPAFQNRKRGIAYTHYLARTIDTIGHCREGSRGSLVICDVRATPALVGYDGTVCFAGVGEIRTQDLDMRAGAAVMRFNYFRWDAGRGRLSKSPTGGFKARFEYGGSLVGVSCSPPDMRG